jgi:FecR protein
MGRVRALLCVWVGVALVWAPVVPSAAGAQATASTAQNAGHVAIVVPHANLQRGTRQLTATPRAAVYWGDIVNTLILGRARIALNDGSILNVGSQSSLRIVKQDPVAQQTQLELEYGRVRAQAVHLTRPGANFEIHSRLGTAGVVGTDFYFSLEGDILTLIVFQGVVRFCNLAGVCVNVGAGSMSTVRGNQSPDTPIATPNGLLVEAASSTTVTPSGGPQVARAAAHHLHWNIWVPIVAAAALAGGVTYIAVSGGNSTPPVQPLTIPCQIAARASCAAPALAHVGVH